ncbi:hypothetical protein [Miltoncostaea oceani]|nr:hypothetical protein [Miltoncostaea oceani]
MPDDDEFDERDPFLLAMLGLVALADDALGAGPPDPWVPPARHDDGPLLR